VRPTSMRVDGGAALRPHDRGIDVERLEPVAEALGEH